MEQEERNEIIEALTAFFLDHGITTMEEFESLDEEAFLWENLVCQFIHQIQINIKDFQNSCLDKPQGTRYNR